MWTLSGFLLRDSCWQTTDPSKKQKPIYFTTCQLWFSWKQVCVAITSKFPWEPWSPNTSKRITAKWWCHSRFKVNLIKRTWCQVKERESARSRRENNKTDLKLFLWYSWHCLRGMSKGSFWQAELGCELWLKCDYIAYLNQRRLISCSHKPFIYLHTSLRWTLSGLSCPLWCGSMSAPAEEMPFCWGREIERRLKGEKNRGVEEGDTFPKPQPTSWDDWLRIITAPFASNCQDGLTELYFTALCWSPLMHTHINSLFLSIEPRTRTKTEQHEITSTPHQNSPQHNYPWIQCSLLKPFDQHYTYSSVEMWSSGLLASLFSGESDPNSISSMKWAMS